MLSRTQNGNQQLIKAQAANLTDVLSSGDFAGQATLNSSNLISATPPATGAQLLTGGSQAQTARRDTTLKIKPFVLSINQDFGDGARAFGSVAITPIVSWEYHFGWRPSGKVSAKALVTGSVTLTASSAWGPKSRDVWLGHYVLAITDIQIGPVPVVLTVELDPTLHLSGQATGALHFEARPLIVVGAQAEGKLFSQPKFTAIYQNNTQLVNPILHGNASAQIGVSLETETYIEGFAALEVKPTPYLRATADITANPWWTIRAGATIQGCASLRGLDPICTPAGWADFGFTVAQASGPFRGISITPQTANTAVGGSIQFTETPINVPDGPVTWSMTQGSGQITQGGLFTADTPVDTVVQVQRVNTDVDERTSQALVHVATPH